MKSSIRFSKRGKHLSFFCFTFRLSLILVQTDRPTLVLSLQTGKKNLNHFATVELCESGLYLPNASNIGSGTILELWYAYFCTKSTFAKLQYLLVLLPWHNLAIFITGNRITNCLSGESYEGVKYLPMQVSMHFYVFVEKCICTRNPTVHFFPLVIQLRCLGK